MALSDYQTADLWENVQNSKVVERENFLGFNHAFHGKAMTTPEEPLHVTMFSKKTVSPVVPSLTR